MHCAATFTPAFSLVAQTNDFDDVFACAAMLSGKKIEEVKPIQVDLAGIADRISPVPVPPGLYRSRTSRGPGLSIQSTPTSPSSVEGRKRRRTAANSIGRVIGV